MHRPSHYPQPPEFSDELGGLCSAQKNDQHPDDLRIGQWCFDRHPFFACC